MTAAGLACRLVDSALGELAERAQQMSDDVVADELEAILTSGRSAGSDLVAGILERERQRREREARHG